MDSLSDLVKYHLRQLSENKFLETWKICSSPVEGRGIFANQDLFPGDLIFVDHALIYGPRISEKVKLGCIVCNSLKNPLHPCENGCELLVCSEECCDSSEHKQECEMIRSWKKISGPAGFSDEKFSRSIAPMRSLILDDIQRKLLMQLVGHDSPQHGGEVRHVKKYFEITSADEDLMMHACRVLDANAYEMVMLTANEELVNLRGLFPTSALLNHACSPNTRTKFDSNGKMYVIATAHIPEGSEVFTSYTGLLWSTLARRFHLNSTKHFMCDCFRCVDKYEFGTNLAAMRCINRQCQGIMLPIDPLNFSSNWKCESCSIEAQSSQIGALQSALTKLIGSAKMETPKDIDDFITQHLSKFLPEPNHIIVELKMRIIWAVGNTEGYEWRAVNAEWLTRVEDLCREILGTCEALRLGATPLAARLHLRLHDCLLEKLRRQLNDRSNAEDVSALEAEVVSHINKSNDILRDDISAPGDLETRAKLANEDVKSLIDMS